MQLLRYLKTQLRPTPHRVRSMKVAGGLKGAGRISSDDNSQNNARSLWSVYLSFGPGLLHPYLPARVFEPANPIRTHRIFQSKNWLYLWGLMAS